jgi:hypothetical protein
MSCLRSGTCGFVEVVDREGRLVIPSSTGRAHLARRRVGPKPEATGSRSRRRRGGHSQPPSTRRAMVPHSRLPVVRVRREGRLLPTSIRADFHQHTVPGGLRPEAGLPAGGRHRDM